MTIMDHVSTNGTRGRKIPALPEHTFQDSGITIKIRKVGPTVQQRLAQAIIKEIPEPPIPIVQTEAGAEPNPADPTYIADYEQWGRKTNSELIRRLMLIAALEAEVTIDDRARTEIARKKRSLALTGAPWQDDPDQTAEENERVFYILYVAAATTDDLREFGDAVRNRSVPTEAAVQAQIDTFRADLPGAGRVQLPPDPALGSEL